jgi:hypothetical protein
VGIYKGSSYLFSQTDDTELVPNTVQSKNNLLKSKITVNASVVKWSEFPVTNTRVPGSIPGVARFFRTAVGLERGPLSLVSITEVLLEWKSSGSRSKIMVKEIVILVLNYIIKHYAITASEGVEL